MFRRLSIFLIAVPVGVALAQSMPELRLPHLSGDRSVVSDRASSVTLDTAVSRYQNRHEAAVAAFQEAYKATTQQKNRARAMGLLMISLKRDPNFGKALFNMAALCEQEQSWNDALAFYKQTEQADAEGTLIALAAEQIVRVQEIARLESTPAGQRQRRYDTQLLASAAKIKDPVVGLEETAKLTRIDAARWEGPALTGILQAGLGHYPDSYTALQQAENLAPAEKRPQLQSAAEVAHREASFLEAVNKADEAWDKQQYEAAAKSYASAWENNPDDAKVGMQAATGFLLADQVPQAVQILSQLRGSAPADTRPKVTAMLKELGAVSDEAKRAADRAPESGASQAAPAGAADRIRTLVGQLTTPQMEMSVRPAPALVDDKSNIVPVVDDELTLARSDLLLLSTESVFTVYQRSAAAIPETPAPAASVPAAPPLPLSAPPAAASDRPAPIQQRLAEPPAPLAPARQPAAAAAKGSERMVEVASTPAGSLVVFDNNPAVTCVAPCQIALTPGRHTLVATLSGHRVAQKIVTVEEKKASSIVIEMVAKQGFLTVESKTPGLPVFVNGKKTDRVTPANLTLAEGVYEIGVEVDGVMKSQSVSVRDGNMMKVSLE